MAPGSHPRVVTRRVPLAVLAARSLLALGWLVLYLTKPWPDPLPDAVLAWVGAGLLALTLLALDWRRQRWWVHVLAGAGAGLARPR
jgi:hypothetical protein